MFASHRFDIVGELLELTLNLIEATYLECEHQPFTCRGSLPGATVSLSRRRRAQDPAASATDALTEHRRERFEGAFHAAPRGGAGSETDASDARPSMYPRSRSGD